MKKVVTALSVFLAIAITVTAQTDEDALRYSRLTFGGTARGLGSAGAFGALGGDFSSLSDNPAGIGIFQSGQLSFTPGFTAIKTSSLFADNKEDDRKYNFNIGGFGIVWVKKLDEKKSDWRNINFGFGMNRLNNYHSRMSYSGFNEGSSLLDYFAESAMGTLPSDVGEGFPFSTGLAYNAYLINPAYPDSLKYISATLGSGTDQSEQTVTRGGTSEYLFSFGGNYKDKLYLGATIGIPSIRYEKESVYKEEDKNDMIPAFNSFNYTQNLTTSGTGVNAKFGLIYRINDYVRIGGGVHSPTFYSLTDKFNSSMTSDLDTVGAYEWTSPDGTFNYNLTTPWRLVGSIAFLFKKYGFISADYEWMDYSESFFNTGKSSSVGDKSYLNAINQSINAKYGTASNIRIGGEFVYDVFRFRLGYALYGSPFKADVAVKGYDYSSQSFTGGLGISDGDYFLDLGFARTESKTFQQPYTLSDREVLGVKINNWSNNFLVTVGVKF